MLSAREYLQHILDETAYILASSAGLDKATFVQDETLKRAFVRSIEIIGEAVKQIPEPLLTMTLCGMLLSIKSLLWM